MPVFDLNSPTGLAFQWGWLLVTRTNAIVYLLIILVFVLGITVRLPGGRRDSASGTTGSTTATVPTGSTEVGR